MIRLTIVSDIDGSTGSENSKKAGIIQASGVCGTVLDLEAGAESLSV